MKAMMSIARARIADSDKAHTAIGFSGSYINRVGRRKLRHFGKDPRSSYM